jgi:hypothetical protein
MRRLNFFLNLPNPSGLIRPWSLLSLQQKWVAEAEKLCFWGVKCGQWVGLTTLPSSVSRLSRQCGILNISQPYRPPWPVTGIALLLYENDYMNQSRFQEGMEWIEGHRTIVDDLWCGRVSAMTSIDNRQQIDQSIWDNQEDWILDVYQSRRQQIWERFKAKRGNILFWCTLYVCELLHQIQRKIGKLWRK